MTWNVYSSTGELKSTVGEVTLNSTQTLTAKKTFEGSTTTDVRIAAQVTSDANNRLQVQSDGKVLWGSGSSSADVTLERSAANTIKLGSGDKIQQNAAPTTGDDLVNKTYADSLGSTGTVVPSEVGAFSLMMG